MFPPKIAWLATLALTLPAVAEQKQLDQSQVKTLLEKGIQVKACGDPAYSFETVQIGQVDRQKYGGKTYGVFPVHARFQVTCRYYDEKVEAEVDIRTGYYIDDFGAWKALDVSFDGNQSWDNTQSDVRCRVKNIADLAVDSDHKVTGSTPAQDQSYFSCTAATRGDD